MHRGVWEHHWLIKDAEQCGNQKQKILWQAQSEQKVSHEQWHALKGKRRISLDSSVLAGELLSIEVAQVSLTYTW